MKIDRRQQPGPSIAQTFKELGELEKDLKLEMEMFGCDPDDA